MQNLSLVMAQSSADDAKADAYVARCDHASPYFLSAWRKAITQAYGHERGCVLAYDSSCAADRSHSKVVGILPFSRFYRPLASTRLISQPFCDFTGPLAQTPAIAAELVHFLQYKEALPLELRYGLAAEMDTPSQKVRMVTALPDSAETLLASYKPKLRSQIKKAEKNGLTAEVRTDLEAVRLFYRVYSINMKRLGSPPHSLAWFEAIVQHYPQGQAVIGLVWFEQQVVGAGLVLLQGQQGVIPWASTLADFNHLAPNMLLYWTLQAHLADHGVRFFDMGRSTPNEGTYRFKKQWGAEPVPLDWQLLQPRQSGITHLLSTDEAGPSRLRALAEKSWQKLPLGLANSLGSRIRRYIAL
ncbi:MAG: GNAT family N-acetyltransferase [Alkalimonas sp.]|nr:GNAT family N-acetyltransferase [Alkalimonas sp.]